MLAKERFPSRFSQIRTSQDTFRRFAQKISAQEKISFCVTRYINSKYSRRTSRADPQVAAVVAGSNLHEAFIARFDRVFFSVDENVFELARSSAKIGI